MGGKAGENTPSQNLGLAGLMCVFLSCSPFYGEDFQCDVPKRFRFLSCYVLEKAGGHMHFQDKVIGKVTLKTDEIHRYNAKDHWFQLMQVEPNTEVQVW
jgi:Ras GTPase-activating protein 3